MLFFVFVHTGLTTYYAKYYLADFSVDPISGEEVFKVSGTFFGIQMSWELLSSLFLTSATLVTLIGTFLIKGAVAKFGKKPTWIACFVLASIFSIAFSKAFTIFIAFSGDVQICSSKAPSSCSCSCSS